MLVIESELHRREIGRCSVSLSKKYAHATFFLNTNRKELYITSLHKKREHILKISSLYITIETNY